MGVGGASTTTEQIAEILDRYPGGINLVDSIECLVSWARANSLWPLVYGTACCAMEMMSAGSSRHDWARFGVEVARATPRQADLIVLAGTIVEKMSSNLITLYQQMPAPKYVIAMGSCAISGGPFYYDSYSVIKGGDRLIPVDVYVPGCPPRPEALLHGIMELQNKIRKEGRRNPWKVRDVVNSPIIDLHTATGAEWDQLEAENDLRMQPAREQFKAENPDYKPPKPMRAPKESFPEVAVTPRRSDNPTSQEVFDLIKTHFPDTAPSSTMGNDSLLEITTSRSQYLDLIGFLKQKMNFNLLLQVTAVDWSDRLDVVVQLLSTSRGNKISVCCQLDRDIPEIETIIPLFLGAEWHEREVYDLFGVRFTGHPDLRRIFLQNDFPGHPMRKDFSDPQRLVTRPY